MISQVLRLISYWIGRNKLVPFDTIYIKQASVDLRSVPNYEEIRR